MRYAVQKPKVVDGVVWTAVPRADGYTSHTYKSEYGKIFARPMITRAEPKLITAEKPNGDMAEDARGEIRKFGSFSAAARWLVSPTLPPPTTAEIVAALREMAHQFRGYRDDNIEDEKDDPAFQAVQKAAAILKRLDR